MRFAHVDVAAVNCGRSCSTAEGQCSIVGAVGDVLPNWGVIFLSEVDALQNRCMQTSPFGHTVYRHWPGEGSVAMQFIARRRVRHLARNVTWKGRCGALHLFQRDSQTGSGINVFIIGVHNSFGDGQIDTLADIACLLRRRP